MYLFISTVQLIHAEAWGTPSKKKNTWPFLSLATKSLPQKKGAMEAWTNNWTITLARHIGQEMLWSYELMVRPMSKLKKSGQHLMNNVGMWEFTQVIRMILISTRWGNSWCHATGIWLQLMRRLVTIPRWLENFHGKNFHELFLKRR